jgi:uncharacterized protein YycO
MITLPIKSKILTGLTIFGSLMLLVLKVYPQLAVKKTSAVELGLRDGDVLLQSGNSKQCMAVKAATHSEFTHCGIYFTENGKGYVYEAVQPVKKTPVTDWIAHGIGARYSVVRLKESDKLLNARAVAALKSVAESYLGKNYDLYFNWGDEQLYCSEYVWKIYKNALNIELGNTRQIKDFDLASPIVKKVLYERYGNLVPLREKVVAPSDLYSAPNVFHVN